MKTIYKRKDWLVETADDGTVRAVGPHGTALYVDDTGIWLDHEVPSAEYEDTYVLDRVAVPIDWFVKALRANGFKVTPPRHKQPSLVGTSVVAAEVPVKKTRFELIRDAGNYLADPKRSKTKVRTS